MIIKLIYVMFVKFNTKKRTEVEKHLRGLGLVEHVH